MKSLRNMFTLVLTSIIGLMTTNAALAADKVHPKKDSSDKNNSLAEILIENEVFQMDQQKQTVQVDEDKLLQVLRTDLEEKIRSNDTHPDDKEIYVDLINKLEPGSFEKKVNGNSGLNSMSFDKATKSVQ